MGSGRPKINESDGILGKLDELEMESFYLLKHGYGVRKIWVKMKSFFLESSLYNGDSSFIFKILS